MQERNSLLRTARLRKGWSQQELADWARVSLSSVQRAERGGALRVDICQRICSALGKERPEELGLRCIGEGEESFESGEETLLGRQTGEVLEPSPINISPSSQNVFTQSSLPLIQIVTPSGIKPIGVQYRESKDSSMIVLELSSVSSVQTATQYTSLATPMTQDIRDTALDRRHFLELGIGATLSVNSLADRLANALKSPSAIDIATLDHLETLTRKTWQFLPEIAGIVSTNLLNYMLEHLQSTVTLLEGALMPTIRIRLCSIASEQALIIGVMLYAMRRYAEAQTYYNASVRSAKEAGNDALQAVGLARMSFITTHNNQVHKSLPLIQEARRLATQSGTVITRAWLAAMEAEVQANMNIPNACLKALEHAELVNISADDDPYGTTFNPFLFTGYKSVCLLQLNQSVAAQQVLQETLAQPHSPSIYQRSSMLADLAAIYIDQGEVREGCKLANQAVMITNQTRSPSMLQYLLDFRDNHLEAWKDTPEVKDLNEKLRFVALTMNYGGM